MTADLEAAQKALDAAAALRSGAAMVLKSTEMAAAQAGPHNASTVQIALKAARADFESAEAAVTALQGDAAAPLPSA